MRDFRDLKVWAKAHQLTLSIYRLTTRFPREEQYGITSQLRRACVSTSSNIAEGCGRSTDRDFARFLSIAGGSASETEYLLIVSKDLGYYGEEEYDRLSKDVNEVKRMLNSFTQKLRADANT